MSEPVRIGVAGPRPTEDEWDRLTADAQAMVCMLVGLRHGKTMNEMADRLEQVVDAVLDTIELTDTGKITGSKGTVKLTLDILPNDRNPHETIKVAEKVENRYPEDRSHVLYVGRRSTLHTTQAHREQVPGLFALREAADGTIEVDEEPTERLPYADE